MNLVTCVLCNGRGTRQRRDGIYKPRSTQLGLRCPLCRGDGSLERRRLVSVVRRGLAKKGIAAALLLACAGLLPSRAHAQTCTPTAKTHQRWDVKTRPTPDSVTAQAMTVASMIAEDVPTVTGLPNAEIPNSDEQMTIGLTGYIMLAKRSPDDCDIHMEIADTPDTTAPRVIVEVPPTLPDVQAQLISMLSLKKSTKRFTNTTAPQLYFQGYGFFDLSHRVNNGDKKGHGHGSAQVATLLEIHPLWGIVRATP